MSEFIQLGLAATVCWLIAVSYLQQRRIDKLQDAIVQLTIRNACTYAAHQRLSEEHSQLWANHVGLVAWATEFVQHYNRHIATCDSFEDEADWWKHGVSPEDFDK